MDKSRPQSPASSVNSSDSGHTSASSTTPPRKHVLVVGLGMVGIAFIEKLLNYDSVAQSYRITVIGDEPHIAYNRVGLTSYFNDRSVEALHLNPISFYQEHEGAGRLHHKVNTLVEKIDGKKKVAYLSDGSEVEYDVCVLSTGSYAALPPYCTYEMSKKTKGVFVYRNIADLDAMIAYAAQPHVKRAAVVGGGLLGLEAAKAVLDLREEAEDHKAVEVNLIERNEWVLSRQLDGDAGRMVLEKVRALNVNVLLKARVRDMLMEDLPGGDAQKLFKGLALESGENHDFQMVVFAVGIKARDELGRVSDIKTHPRGGFVVNDDLSTNQPDIYAVGECANWHGETFGLIGPGVEMADVLAFNLTEGPKHKMRTMKAPDLSTKLKLLGVDVASFGDFFADKRGFVEKPGHVGKGVRSTRTKAKPAAKEETEREIEDKKQHNTDATTDVSKAPPFGNERDIDTYAKTPGGPATGVSADVIARETKDKAHEYVAAPKQDERKSNGAELAEKSGHLKTEAANGTPAGQIAVKALTYRDPFSAVYKKYLFTEDGKYILGGMMIGDTSDFVKLVAMVKGKKPIDIEPSTLIVGAGGKDDGGDDLPDDAQVCSCHNVTKAQICQKVADGSCTAIGEVKSKTKAGTGCGGCMPLITNIFNSSMKSAGKAVNNFVCPHFQKSREDLYNIIKFKKLKSLKEVMAEAGVRKDAIGCEICKPCVGSIFSSLWNESVIEPVHHSNQDTNDRWMANTQRDGTFSIIPRVAAGEITPEKLIVLGKVAQKWNLYTKITGGQRIDLFGAQKHDLPAIWEELVDGGFESGHGYGKALRTVKSCVGTSWCRYGVGDSVTLAIALEERYKGIRSPHKVKGGISGCVRECAEAQSKDFGCIATEKGFNVFVCGNGGAKPRHAVLLAGDVPPSQVIPMLDRFMMFYIRTADRLERTARWLERMDGGIEKLRKVIVDDELGIGKDLEKEMAELIETYECEWTEVVKNPTRRAQFRKYVNAPEDGIDVESITERGQRRPAAWPKELEAIKFRRSDIKKPYEDWVWKAMLKTADLRPTDKGTTSGVIKYGGSQIAIFHIPDRGYYATQNMCPHKRAFVLSDGLVGDNADGQAYVSCPLHKRNYLLENGDCTNDSSMSIMTFELKVEGEDILLRLPAEEDLDAVIGTKKWMIRQVEKRVEKEGSNIEVAGPKDSVAIEQAQNRELVSSGGGKLDW